MGSPHTSLLTSPSTTRLAAKCLRVLRLLSLLSLNLQLHPYLPLELQALLVALSWKRSSTIVITIITVLRDGARVGDLDMSLKAGKDLAKDSAKVARAGEAATLGALTQTLGERSGLILPLVIDLRHTSV